MAGGSIHPILHFIRKIVAAHEAGESSDGQLLRRFIGLRDESAFAALLHKHGPMVLGVCRRLLHDLHDSEDAFQATFLLLIRKAGAIRNQESVGSWLYGVAYRIAVRAKAERGRRRDQERQNAVMFPIEPVQDAIWRELRPVLDEEVNRLPEKYRQAFVLCHLEGKTNVEAARELGCPTGTVDSRLARARERLRDRLTKRGLTIPACGLAAALAQNVASAAVPIALAGSTMKAALLMAAGTTAAAGVISTQAAALMEGVLKAMFVTKLKIAAAVALTVGMVGGGGALTYGTMTRQAGQVANGSSVTLTKIEDDPPKKTTKARSPDKETHSQDKATKEKMPVLVIEVGHTRGLQTSSQKRLVLVGSSSSQSVVTLKVVGSDPTRVQIIGNRPGIDVITLKDEAGTQEKTKVLVVPTGSAAVRVGAKLPDNAIAIEVGETARMGMSTKNVIRKFEISNEKVATVRRAPVDVNLPNLSAGAERLLEIRGRQPGTARVVLTSQDDKVETILVLVIDEETAKPAVEADEELKKLLKKRVEVAQAERRARHEEFNAGRTTLDMAIHSCERFLKANLELSNKKADQITAYEVHLEFMKELEQINEEKLKGGKIAAGDAAQAKYYRLEAEIMLKRAKGK